MATYFINYNNTVDIATNKRNFMNKYFNNIYSLHTKQVNEEHIITNSYKQYEVLEYYLALEYCINLFFLSLERLEDETIIESLVKMKANYNYDTIQTNMAHKNIDLDNILEDIYIGYTPITHEH